MSELFGALYSFAFISRLFPVLDAQYADFVSAGYIMDQIRRPQSFSEADWAFAVKDHREHLAIGQKRGFFHATLTDEERDDEEAIVFGDNWLAQGDSRELFYGAKVEIRPATEQEVFDYITSGRMGADLEDESQSEIEFERGWNEYSARN